MSGHHPLEGILVLECVKFPRGCACSPEALEECLHSSKGYKRRPAWLIYWGGCPASFQLAQFLCWCSDP